MQDKRGTSTQTDIAIFMSQSINYLRGTKMKYQPIQIQFIMPSKASAWARRSYRHLQHLIVSKGAVNLELTQCRQNEDAFNARLIIKELTPPEDAPRPIIQKVDFCESDLCSETGIAAAAREVLRNPAYPTLKPNQRLYTLMALLDKPVRVQQLCRVCGQILHLRSETVRGALNKNRSLYVSPKHGIWCTSQLAKSLGLKEYRDV